VRIISVEAIPLDARLRAPFRFGRVERTTSSNVLVKITSDDGAVGWGEACPVPQLTSETRESIAGAVSGRVTQTLLGREPTSWRPLMDEAAGQLHGYPATRAAIETALMDLVGRALGVSVAELLGGRYREDVEVHGSVGWEEDPSAMAETAVRQADRYRMLKLYVGRADLRSDLGRLEAVRKAVGDDHPFLLDINGLWTSAQAIAAGPALAATGVTILEQPVQPGDVEGAVEVTRVLGERHAIQVAADEAVLGPQDALRVARDRTAHMVNVGMTKLGGPAAAHGVATVAAACELTVLLGSVVELGVATAAGLQLAAALPRLPAPAYLGGPAKYVRQVTTALVADDRGFMRIPAGPGLGIEVDEEGVRELDLRSSSRTANVPA
jgi:L-alanine-DL-glutamate epimerase-like enolase superfamily enzyme